MSVTVVVTDGEQRAALAATRALGRAGYRVVVASAGGRSLAGASKYASREAEVGNALVEPSMTAERLAALCLAEAAAVLLPVTEATALAVLAEPARFSHVKMPGPDLARFRQISDKAAVLAAAAGAGIAVPEQRRLEAPPTAAELKALGLRFPVVVKPSRSVAEAGSVRLKLGVLHAATPIELDRALATLPAAAYPLLLQQRIMGPGVGVFLLLWGGAEVARFAHRRIREKPPSGGVSVFRESIAADPALVARSRALLDHFGWEGVAMVEYKLDAATGTPYLMEINGRLWGSLQLAIDAGVDFPVLLIGCLLGRPPAPIRDYRLGVRSRWEWGDVDHLLARLRHGAARLALPPGSPGRLATLAAVLRPNGPGVYNEVLRWDDPRPFLRESAAWFLRR